MMQPRCAVCDGDNDLQTLCHTHHVWAEQRRKVRDGALSDWPPLPTGKYPWPVNHRAMLLNLVAPPLCWQASVLTLLTCAGVVWDDGQSWQESYGDWLAGNWLIDWRAINGNGNGKAA